MWKSIEQLVKEFEATEEGRQALQAGRQWVADEFYGGDLSRLTYPAETQDRTHRRP